MKFYHATGIENMKSIYDEGEIRNGWDGYVYLCKKDIDACKFLVIRGLMHVGVIEIEMDEDEVEKSFDHAEGFFGCKAYVHYGAITDERWTRIYEYEFE